MNITENTKKKNNELIEELVKENKELEHIRNEIIVNRKAAATANLSKTVGNTLFDPKDDLYYKKTYDTLKSEVTKKRKYLLTIQDKLTEVNDIKNAGYEESPLTRQIRILENKLDKIMIKFNEAQSIKKTYEQIVKRLKEERIGYDNQLASIERSLKGKEHDYTELLLLSHDATHAKEMAQTELKRFESKNISVSKLREKYIEDKKRQLELKGEQMERNERNHKEAINLAKEKEINKNKVEENNNTNKEMFGDINIGEEILDLEEGFKKLNQITGVSDVNEIIQKYIAQDETGKSLKELEMNYLDKIKELSKEKDVLKRDLDVLKFEKSSKQSKKIVEEIEKNVQNSALKSERYKQKYGKTNKLFINLKAGIDHLSENLEFYYLDKRQAEEVKQYGEGGEYGQILFLISEKLKSIFKIISADPLFSDKIAKNEPLFKKNEFLDSYVNPNLFDKNLKKEQLSKIDFSVEDEGSEEYYDEEF